ncbi:unnamed protein product [Angiostrongylus costaricensis]|uniref:Uncharacterized protein n=1 Tax=Angiostrongylus costaricensis TaxID=334426 RepID=A0A0R3PH98_ANGCS|nr:unnamed protein product [Angiostrongylus costaricensis]
MYYSVSVLLAVLLLKSITYAQNAVCPQCSTLNGGHSSNPLVYFTSPSDFGNQLGQAIATRINEGYKSGSASRITFGSYPYSGYGSQGYGGSSQSYVIQPEASQQTMSSYNNQGIGGYPSSYGSYPNYGNYGYGSGQGQQIQIPSSGYSTYGNVGSTSYGNTFGSYGGGYSGGYGGSYGIPDPITTGGSSGGGGSGGNCPYCFGNKGGYKMKRSKRAKRSTII